MESISRAIRSDDQPVFGLLGENQYLTSFVTPDSLEIQEAYKELTKGSTGQRDRITAIWQYIKDIPYTEFVRAKVSLDGKVFSQGDVWLEPAMSLKAPKLNCMNKSTLLVSLLRQELSPDSVFVCLNNISVNGVGGHAVGYLRLEDDYILETTNARVSSPFLKARDMDIYEAVIFMNDKGVFRIPGRNVEEPLGLCCIRWLEDYINDKLCEAYY